MKTTKFKLFKVITVVIMVLFVLSNFTGFLNLRNDFVLADDIHYDGWAPQYIYRDGPNGIGVYQSDLRKPAVTATYTPKDTSGSKASDPWSGGIIHIHYENIVRANASNITTLQYLFGMAAYIKLPEEVKSAQIINSTVGNPTLTIDGTAIPLSGNPSTGVKQLVAVDDKFLKLTMRKPNSDAKYVSDRLSDIVGGVFGFPFYHWGRIPIAFDIDIDVSKMSPEGVFPAMSYQKPDQPNLETGKQVIPKNSSPLSIDFYGRDDVIEAGNPPDFWGNSKGIDIIYSKYKEETPMNRATSFLTGWNQEIIPKDNTSKYEVQKNNQLVVPDPVKNVRNRYAVTLDNDEEMFGPSGTGFDPARFINAIDVFDKTKKNAKIDFADASNPDNLGAKDALKDIKPGETKNILYYGTNSYYTGDFSSSPLTERLSPVVLQVTRKKIADPELSATSILKNLTTGEIGQEVNVDTTNIVSQTDSFALTASDYGAKVGLQQVKLNLPPNVDLDELKGIRVGRTTYHTSELVNGVIALRSDAQGSFGWQDDNGYVVGTEFIPGKNYKLDVQYDYTINANPEMDVPVNGSKLKLTMIDGVSDAVVAETTNQLKLKFNKPTLSFIEAPMIVDFGEQAAPILPTTFDANATGKLVVKDTLNTNDWSINLQLGPGEGIGEINNNFPGTLSFNDKEIPFNGGAVNIYSKDNNDKGELTIYGTDELKFGLLLLPNTVTMDTEYQGTLTWTLQVGPTQ